MAAKMVPLRLIISYFLPHIRKYKWSFYLVFIGYGMSFFLGGIIQPLYYKEIMDTVTSAENSTAVANKLVELVWAVGAIIVIRNIGHRLTDYVMVFCQSKILQELNNYTLAKLQDHSYQFFVNNFQGSLVAKTRRFVRSFEALHDKIVYSFLQTVIQLLGVFVVLFLIAPAIAWFFALWCLLFIGLSVLLVQKKRIYDLKEAAADSRKTGGLADAITGFLNIKTFAALSKEIERFEEITDDEEKARRSAWNFNNLIMIVHSVVWLVLEVVGLYLVVKFWIDGAVSAGTIVLVQTYFMVIGGIMWNLREAITSSMRAVSDASEMIEIFEQRPDILDPAYPEPCRIKDGRIVFDRASFAYGDSISVFKDFNLVIEPKQKVGLVGSSGAGKTTVTKLLLRFVDVVGGSIIIDGQDITKMAQDELRDKIAYVPQDPVLFHRSLRENIAYGRPDASEEEIIEVAKKANAHDFIARFPQGYDTFVGERGVKLSGGERQRIAVARATLKNAPILILDEATSSLDSLSEKYVQEAFAWLMEGRTVIVIAHRLSTIRRMDRIIVLDYGSILEEGKHEELIRKKGMYYNLWVHQSDGFIS